MMSGGRLCALGVALSDVRGQGWDRQGSTALLLVVLSLDSGYQVEGRIGCPERRLHMEGNTKTPAVLRPMAAADNPYANLTHEHK